MLSTKFRTARLLNRIFGALLQVRAQAETEAHRDALSNQLDQSQRELKELAQQIVSSSEKILSLEASHENVRTRADELSQELKASNALISEEQARKKVLEAEIGSLQANLTGELMNTFSTDAKPVQAGCIKRRSTLAC